MSKIASFESLECLMSQNLKDLSVISFVNSPCALLSQANYKRENIFFLDKKSESTPDLQEVWKDEKNIINETNLTDILRKNNITDVIIDTVSSPEIENWAEKNNLNIIAPKWKFQKEIENKIFFDEFLTTNNISSPSSWILRTETDVENVERRLLIVQVPESNGSSGTFLVKEPQEIKMLMKEHDLTYPLLCREYIDHANTLGVSVLIGKKNMIFSALRTQAYFLNDKGESKYFGIQWTKTSSFDESILEKINQNLLKIGQNFQAMGFRGIANFDFMVRRGEIYFIECNPRLGGATPQISAREELLHGLTFVEEFAKCCRGEELSVNRPFIPKSNYEGFNLDFDVLFHEREGTSVKMPRPGFYREITKGFSFISENRHEFEDEKTIFIYNFLPREIKVDRDIFMGFAMTHNPLLNLEENTYSFSERGKDFLKKIKTLFLLSG
ncbi:ATP-grasp domain-containing protein [Candidatus Gracilibacteria bacterium]|nr:ATP-grasp domain-containing protein [Candidatus Gracilibacteria bacterium]